MPEMINGILDWYLALDRCPECDYLVPYHVYKCTQEKPA